MANHDAAAALPYLRLAVDQCPPERRTELSRRLYWLSMALRRLDRQTLAIKALASARQLSPRGPVSRSFYNITNGYGQPRCACEEHDDYRAFFSVQVKRYLWTVPGQRFADNSEMEIVLEVIAKAWLQLQKEISLDGLDCRTKLACFDKYRINFPVLRQGSVGGGRVRAIEFPSAVAAQGTTERLPMPWEQRCF